MLSLRLRERLTGQRQRVGPPYSVTPRHAHRLSWLPTIKSYSPSFPYTLNKLLVASSSSMTGETSSSARPAHSAT